MAAPAVTWVWTLDLPQAEKLVMLALAESSSMEGICWPSKRTIASMTGMSTRSVQRHLVAVESKGLIRKERREDQQTKRQTSNRYALCFPQEGVNLSRWGRTTHLPRGGQVGSGRGSHSVSLVQQQRNLPEGQLLQAAVVVVEQNDSQPQQQSPHELIPPTSLSSDEQQEAIELACNAPWELRQQILDEIEGGLRAKRVENWRGLLHTLITRGFTPNRCRAIEGERRRRAEDEHAAKLRAVERANRKPVDPERNKLLIEKARAEILRQGSSPC